MTEPDPEPTPEPFGADDYVGSHVRQGDSEVLLWVNCPRFEDTEERDTFYSNPSVAPDGPQKGMQCYVSSTNSYYQYNGYTWTGGLTGPIVDAELQPLPNGDSAWSFDGKTDYLEGQDASNLSIADTGELTWSAWISPSSLEFPNSHEDGYVHWISKGSAEEGYEWLGRIYSQSNPENRPNRISGYAFSADGGLGTGVYTQQVVTPGEWIHITVTYNISATPNPDVQQSIVYPDSDTGRIRMYRNGVLTLERPFSPFHHHDEIDRALHAAYAAAHPDEDQEIIATDTGSPFRLGSRDTASGLFFGRIAKVSVWDRELLGPEILNHYNTMMMGADYDYEILYTAPHPVAYWSLSDDENGLNDQRGLNDLTAHKYDPPQPGNPVAGMPSWSLLPDGSLVIQAHLSVGGGSNLNGPIIFGGDNGVRLYRTPNGELKTDANFISQTEINAYGSIHSGGELSCAGPFAVDAEFDGDSITIFNEHSTGRGIWFRAGSGLSNNALLRASTMGDTFTRFQVRGTGRLDWGPGNASTDTNLYRSAAGTLRTDSNLLVSGDLTVYGEFSGAARRSSDSGESRAPLNVASTLVQLQNTVEKQQDMIRQLTERIEQLEL